MPSSELLGSETPRLFTPPLRRLTRKTTRGFEAIEFAETVLGLRLHPWQKWLLLHALELRPDGTFRFRTIVVLVARQNGKTTLVQVLALWRMYVDGAALVIGTAQNLDVAEEAWEGAVEIAQGTPELADEIAHVDRTNGKKALRLETGERYKVAAANRRGGRGLSGDLVVLDELREHQTWQAWGAVTKTTMARSRAQVWGLSNAGDATSVVLGSLRKRALKALGQLTAEGLTDDDHALEDLDDGSLGLFEWSARRGCALTDRKAWADANPSLGHPNGVTESAIRGALATDTEAVVRTEVLCQWVDTLRDHVIDPLHFAGLEREVESDPDRPYLAVEVALDRSSSTIGACWRVDNVPHVELVDEAPGTEWVVPKIIALKKGERPIAGVVIDMGTEAAGFAEPLEAAGVKVIRAKGADRAAACGAFYDAAVGSAMTHSGDPALAEALAAAAWKDIGDGLRVFGRRASEGDIQALYVAAYALWACVRPQARTFWGGVG